MATTDFATLRNLAFYDGAEQDYFYFKSLETYKMKGGNDSESQQKAAAYNARAKEIANSAKNALSTFPSFAEDENTLASEQINKLIKFIEEAVKTEKNNEIAYFKNKKKLRTRIREKEACFCRFASEQPQDILRPGEKVFRTGHFQFFFSSVSP